MMKKMKIIALLLTLMMPTLIFASDKYIFVVDLSGSMSGTAIENTKASMLKLAISLYKNKANKPEIALVGSNTSESCGGTPALVTKFYDKFTDISKDIAALTTNNSDIIPNGYRYAQEMLDTNKASGKSKIFMFGDGDGLDMCGGFESINSKLTDNSKPVYNFSYVGTGWSPDEKVTFTNQFANMNQSVFDFEELLTPPNTQDIEDGFKNARLLNSSGDPISEGSQDEVACIDVGNVAWEAKALDSSSPQYIRRTFIKSSNNSPDSSVNCKKNCALDNYIAKLNDDAFCGISDWRLPDINQLRTLKLLTPTQRSQLFKTLRKWPHISGTKGKFKHKGQIKGINFDDDNEYDFLETKPYAAILVGVPGLEAKITIPEGLLESEAIILPNTPTIPVIPVQPVTPLVTTVSLTHEELNKTFRKFIAETSHVPTDDCQDHLDNYDRVWDDPNYTLNENAPVTCVNENDVNTYISWYNSKFSTRVRLQTYKEWLNLANSQVSKKGDCSTDNLLDDSYASMLNVQDRYQCNDGSFEPSAYNKYPANSAGIYGVLGNVSELVLMCEKPANCNKYAIVGESWRRKIDDLTQTMEFTSPQNDVGFRLVAE
jgi:hypothetical protein